MQKDVFRSIQQIVHDRSGIDLKEGKAQMVSARISRRLRELQLQSEQDYLDFLRKDTNEIVQLLNVISTNVTRFFREKAHFEFTTGVLKSWLNEGQDKLRIWSAASSTGQEPYSLLMTIAETLRQARRACDYRLLGTDISTRVLEKAESGSYDNDEIEGIPPDLLRRYFDKTAGGHQVKQSLRDHAVFRRMNLNEPPFPMQGPLDMVFCCNVMIYFNAETKRRLLTDIHRLLRPDGFLVVSHTESLTGLTDLYRPVQPSIYAKADAPAHVGVQTEQSQ
ncbi:MAG: CheR family methyltransferase [Planctomycetota bacterium]